MRGHSGFLVEAGKLYAQLGFPSSYVGTEVRGTHLTQAFTLVQIQRGGESHIVAQDAYLNAEHGLSGKQVTDLTDLARHLEEGGDQAELVDHHPLALRDLISCDCSSPKRYMGNTGMFDGHAWLYSRAKLESRKRLATIIGVD